MTMDDETLDLIERKANEVVADGTFRWPDVDPENFISLVQPGRVLNLVARLRDSEASEKAALGKLDAYREALVAIATPGPTFATTFKRGSTRGNSMRECRRIAVKALAEATR